MTQNERVIFWSSLFHMARRAPADDYNWCVVPHRPWDTLLFAGIAVVVACLSQGPYSSLIVLIAGECLLQNHFKNGAFRLN